MNWDVPNQSFEIRFPGNPRTYTWKLGRTVTETGAHKFGSSQDDDKSSKPIATLTYNILFLVDLPNGQKQLAVFTAARTGVKPVQLFISTVKAMGIDAHYQKYRIVVQKKSGPTGDAYFSFDLQYIGEVESEAEARMTRGLYDSYIKSGFIVDTGEEHDAPPPPKSQAASDFVPRDTDDIPFMVPWQ